MSVEVIDKLKQKNNGTFKIIDLDDVDYDGTGKSAKEALDEKATTAIDDNSTTATDKTLSVKKILALVEQCVQKEEGKKLSSNDYTTAEKEKLSVLENYDDSEIKASINTKANKTTAENLQTQINNLVLGAVGDGNNAEVVQARDIYPILNDRLVDIQNNVMTLSNNLFDINSCLENTSLVTWGTPVINVNDTYTKAGSITSGIFNVKEGETYFYLNKNSNGEIVKATLPIANKYDSKGNFLGTFNFPNTGYTVEQGVSYLRFTGNSFNEYSQFKVSTSDLTIFEPYGYSTKVVTFENLNKEKQKIIDNIQIEIKEINRRITNLEKHNGFTFKSFDKTYFAFVFDDAYSNIVTQYPWFKSKGIILSTAVIIENLENATIKNTVDTIVADGGEVLSHYNIDLTSNTSDSVWKTNTIGVKRKLNSYGYDVRGIIRANSSEIGSDLGEMYCRLYFDYSDGLGKSPQYKLTRKFIRDFTTVDEFKSYVDTCCLTPGFYPICLHGTESLCTESYISQILDYIISKGNNVCECTTYSNVMDVFGTTQLEKRLTTLESK